MYILFYVKISKYKIAWVVSLILFLCSYFMSSFSINSDLSIGILQFCGIVVIFSVYFSCSKKIIPIILFITIIQCGAYLLMYNINSNNYNLFNALPVIIIESIPLILFMKDYKKGIEYLCCSCVAIEIVNMIISMVEGVYFVMFSVSMMQNIVLICCVYMFVTQIIRLFHGVKIWKKQS